MKTTQLPILLLSAAFLALAGCGKAEADKQPTPVFDGVSVDLPKLDAAFASAGADQQGYLERIRHNFRYGLYPRALQELEKLAQAPNLTDAQKKTVAELTEQVKQVMAKAAAK